MRVTEAGARFLDYTRSAFSQIDHTVKTAGAAGRGENGLLQIGNLSSIGAGFLRELIRPYRDQHPEVALDIYEVASREYVALIRKGRLDVAFVMGTPVVPNCGIARFWIEGLFAVLPHEHPLCAQEEVGWRALRDEHFILRTSDPGSAIQDYLIKRVASLGHRPSIQLFDVGRETTLHLVALGLGVSLTTEATTASSYPGIEFRPIANAGSVIPFSGVWLPKNDNRSSGGS